MPPEMSPLLGARRRLPETPEETAEKPRFWGQTLPAAVRTENLISSSIIATRRNEGLPQIGTTTLSESEYDPFEEIVDTPYAEYASYFVRATDPAHVSQIKSFIDQELTDRETLSRSGTGAGLMAGLMAGAASPEMLIPVGGQVYRSAKLGQSVLRSVASVAGAGAVGASISEAGLQATQATRTMEESALNIAAGAAFGGILGGAGGLIAGRRLAPDSPIRKLAQFEKQGGAQVQVVREGSVGAAQVVRLSADAMTPMGSIKVGEALAGTNPMSRVLYRSGSRSAMSAVLGMAETPLMIEANDLGISTVKGGAIETQGKVIMGDVIAVEDAMTDLFSTYRTGEVKGVVGRAKLGLEDKMGRTGGKLTETEFNEAVSVALEQGAHEIPEVQEAAKIMRGLIDTLGKEAQDLDLIPEGLVGGKQINGVYYRPIVYDVPTIRSNRQGTIGQGGDAGFEDVLAEHFQVDAGRAQDDLAKAESDLTELKQKQSAALDKIEAERDALLAKRAAFNSAMLDRPTIRELKSYLAQDRSAPKYPLLGRLKKMGGVRLYQPGGGKALTPLAAELQNMGITPRTLPGLFRKNEGMGSLDNIDPSSFSELSDLPLDTTGNYLDPIEVMDAIGREQGGERFYADIEEGANTSYFLDLADDWERRGVDFSKKLDEIQEQMADIVSRETLAARMDDMGDVDQNSGAMTDEDILNMEPDVEANFATVSNRSPENRFTREDRRRLDALEKNMRTIERIGSERANARFEEIFEEIGHILDDSFTPKDLRKMTRLEERMDMLDRLSRADDPAVARELARETTDEILGMRDAELARPTDPGVRGMLKERLLNIPPDKIRRFTQNNSVNVLRKYARVMATDIAMVKRFGDVELSRVRLGIKDDFNAQRMDLRMRELIGRVKASEELGGELGRWSRTVEGRRMINAASRGLLTPDDVIPENVLAELGNTPAFQKAQRKLADLERKTMRDVMAIRDRIRGNYAQPNDPYSRVHQAERGALMLNYMRFLGGMTVSAIPDLAMSIFRHGFRRTISVHMRLMSSAASYKGSMREIKLMGIGTEMALDTRLGALIEYHIGDTAASKFGQKADQMTKNFGKLSLMTPWNATLKQINGVMFGDFAVKTARKMRDGTATKKEIREMASWNLDMDAAVRIADMIDKHSPNYDKDLILNTFEWSDVAAANEFRAAMANQVDKTILTPGQEKPLWMSRPGWRLLGQFKSFAMAATQMILVSGMQRRSSEVVSGVLSLVALGMLTYAVKEKEAGRDLPPADLANSGTWLKNGIDRSGVTGILMDLNNMTERMTDQNVGITPALNALGVSDNQIASRYRNRNKLGAVLGPTFGLGNDVLDVVGGGFGEIFGEEGDGLTAGDIGKARRMLPFQNIPYLRSAFDEFEEGLERAFGEDEGASELPF